LFTLSGSQAFWIFASIELGFLSVAILAARLIGAKKPNETKTTIYECGQKPYGEARSFRILGITRYFGYAVAFFALDAFAWIILTSAISVSFTLETVSILLVYSFIIALGLAYFLVERKNLVR
jgi:NADH:ubiquinone oxidoreductase subunit 3 (subunit A)